MPFTTICPHCDARLTAPDAVRGKKFTCKKCDERFVARPAVDREDDEDDRPRSRRSGRGRGRDDEDEPRSRGGRSGKKKGGAPVLLFVLLGVGALVVIGGGIAAAVYFASPKKGGPTRTADGGGGGPVSMAGWVEYADPEARFRVKFPERPQVNERTEQTPAGPVNQKMAQLIRLKVSFFVTSNPLRPGSDAQQVLAREMDNAWGPKPWNGLVDRRTPADHQGRPGRELTMTGGFGERGFLRMYVANDRFYVLLAWGEGVQPGNSEVAAFFQSLTFD
jgi:hypothetical protein